MVVDVINTTNKNLKNYEPKSIKDIYKADHLIVDFSEKMKNLDKQLKSFLSLNMYNHFFYMICSFGKYCCRNNIKF